MLASLNNVFFTYQAAPIVQGTSFAVHENEKIGLIGANGEGKTTLLKLLLGQLTPDSGEVFLKAGARIGYLEQNGGFESESTVYEAMRAVFREDEELIAKLSETQSAMANATEEELRVLSARCESLQKRIAARDSYRYEIKIKTVLNGMGFQEFYDHKISVMSGGEKTRLKLCRLLLEEPDLLILDEPTNHLDVKTMFWLEDYLSTYRGALLTVSHDRYFLDRLTSRTLELERGKVESYAGNYTKYKVLKAERVKVLEREYEKKQEEAAKLQDYIDRNLVRATTAKSVLSRVKKLDKLEMPEKPLPPPEPPRFSFSYDERPSERVLSAPDFTLKAGEKTLLAHAKFELLRGEKCALVGDNGTGKSSLLKFFLSKSPAVQIGRMVKIAYYDQENADLDPEARVLDEFWRRYSLMSQTDARKLLAQAGLSADDVMKKVKELSGGLRAKLELSILEGKRANVLFLDEPTNHLDLPARESLEEALRAFDGTLLFVSHDRRFIEAVATRVTALSGGTLTEYRGGYGEYLEAMKSVQKPEREQKEKPPEQSGYRSKEERAKEAQRRTRMKEIETRLETLEAEEAALNEELIHVAADYLAVQKITSRLNEIHAESNKLYAEYETLI